MKSINICIERLGAIRNSSLEIKPLTILSGMSGLGKSYLAMLIHYVYKVLNEDEFEDIFSQNGWTLGSMVENSGDSGKITIPLNSMWKVINESAIVYMKSRTGNPNLDISINIEFPIESSEVVINYELNKVKIGDIERQSLSVSIGEIGFSMAVIGLESGTFAFRTIFQYWLRKEIMGEETLRQVCLLIPGRGALLSLNVNDQNYLKKNSGMIDEFLHDWNIIKTMAPHEYIDNEISQMLIKINGGNIQINESQNLFYCMRGLAPMPISASASSVKELTPLSMLLSKYPPKELSILFEEPEAHLHPSKQFEIADLIVEMINRGAHLQITTHSDYFVRRINDRLVLGKIRQQNENKCKEICRKYGYSISTLEEDKLGAYVLSQRDDGTVEITSQPITDEGIPYTTFNEALTNVLINSIDIIEEYKKQSHATEKNMQ